MGSIPMQTFRASLAASVEKEGRHRNCTTIETRDESAPQLWSRALISPNRERPCQTQFHLFGTVSPHPPLNKIPATCTPVWAADLVVASPENDLVGGPPPARHRRRRHRRHGRPAGGRPPRVLRKGEPTDLLRAVRLRAESEPNFSFFVCSTRRCRRTTSTT